MSSISSVLTTDKPLLLTTDYSNTHLQLPSIIWSRPRQQLRFFLIFWILRIFHNEYMHKPWSPAILGTGNSFETWWWYWYSGLIMNIGPAGDIMRFEKVNLTLHLKVFYIKSVYKHMELCEYENYNWPNIRDKRLSNGKLFSIFLKHWKKTSTEKFLLYLYDWPRKDWIWIIKTSHERP